MSFPCTLFLFAYYLGLVCLLAYLLLLSMTMLLLFRQGPCRPSWCQTHGVAKDEHTVSCSCICLPSTETIGRPVPARLAFASILISASLPNKGWISLALLIYLEPSILPLAHTILLEVTDDLYVFGLHWKQSASTRTLLKCVYDTSVSCFASVPRHLCSSATFCCFLNTEGKEVTLFGMRFMCQKFGYGKTRLKDNGALRGVV